jgi:hypothetical protein
VKRLLSLGLLVPVSSVFPVLAKNPLFGILRGNCSLPPLGGRWGTCSLTIAYRFSRRSQAPRRPLAPQGDAPVSLVFPGS